MKKFILLILILVVVQEISAQKYLHEKLIVQVGTVKSKYDTDTTGIRKAFDRAEAIHNATGLITSVEFAPGTYALDSTYIRLRDSVNIIFSGECKFTGKHTNGIFADDSIATITTWYGEPVITHQTSLLKRINLKNAASKVNGFYWRYEALLAQDNTNAPTAVILNNTLGGTVTWTRDDTGTYYCTLTGGFKEDKVLLQRGIVVEAEAGIRYWELLRISDDALILQSYNSSGSVVELNTARLPVSIKVFP